MKKLALALAVIGAVAFASDIAVAQGRGGGGGGGGGSPGGSSRGGGAGWRRPRRRGSGWHGGGSGGSWRGGGSGGGWSSGGWHGGGWHGGGWQGSRLAWRRLVQQRMAWRLVGPERRRRRGWPRLLGLGRGLGLGRLGLGRLGPVANYRHGVVPDRYERFDLPGGLQHVRGRGFRRVSAGPAATGRQSLEFLVLLHRSRGLLPVRPELLQSLDAGRAAERPRRADRPGAAMTGRLRISP